MTTSNNRNRLGDETIRSAYLLQHKDNPIHWWSYGPEALEEAREQNKPIFLSVGYSSCHWCHVMAHESFENEEIANYLNENFVCIKVDREEHPDIDAYYQQACQLYTRSGGWPLSAFLLPDMRPYFVGTYFPAQKKGEATSFPELLRELKRAFNEERDRVEENATKVTEAIAAGPTFDQRVEFGGHFPAPSAILDALKDYADTKNGGFGEAPKFPLLAFYEWAIEQMLEGMVAREFGEHIVASVEKMIHGGLYDQARGGLHRYSTDNEFLVPHFEKMLYDQAGLLKVLAKLSLIVPSPMVFDSLVQTLEYLEKEMFSEKKYFFSAQDADSEGMEGLYHTFTYEEFEDAINNASSDTLDLSAHRENLIKWFGVTKNGNFDQGLNVLSLSWEDRREIYSQDNWQMIRAIRRALLAERARRIPPLTDTKGVASWNFMMASALIDVMQYCQVAPIRQMASKLFNPLMEGLYENFLSSRDDKGMRLNHTTTRQGGLLYFEDYVFFTEAMLRVYEITGNPVFKENATTTLQFIDNEFVSGDEVFTRALSQNDHELYPNQRVSVHDSSFRSPLATYIGLKRRIAILTMDPELAEISDGLKDRCLQESLRNPVSAGEALRSFTYPKEAYRVVKVPKAWATEEKFLNFLSYFLPRFVIDYTEATDTWEICNIEACELQGSGVDHFIETLTPKRPEASEESEGQD